MELRSVLTEQTVVGLECHVSVLDVHCLAMISTSKIYQQPLGTLIHSKTDLTLLCAQHQLRCVYLYRPIATVPVVYIHSNKVRFEMPNILVVPKS